MSFPSRDTDDDPETVLKADKNKDAESQFGLKPEK